MVVGQILKSKNIYLDSRSGIKGKGDNFQVYLPGNSFTVKDCVGVSFKSASLSHR